MLTGNASMKPKPFCTPELDDGLLWDQWLSAHQFPALAMADEIGLFATLLKAPGTTGEIATRLSVAPRALRVYLGYLAAMGFLERENDQWHPTAMTRVWLDRESSAYWGPLLRNARRSHPIYDQMRSTLTRSDVIANPNSSVPEWERGELTQAQAESIAGFMNAHSLSAAAALARHPCLEDVGSLLDVGGGSGVFSIAAAKAHESLRATVLDLEAMCLTATEYISASGIGERVDTVSVNMFMEDLPRGYEAHLYSNIFHDWSDETNAVLAAKSFASLPSGGRLLLHEMLVDEDGCGPQTTLSFSLLMLMSARGRQYRLSELKSILETAGFVEVKAAVTGSGYYSVVSAKRP